MDLVAEGTQDGEAVLVLVECRTTIGGGGTKRIAEKLGQIAEEAEQKVVKIIVAMNIHPSAEEVTAEQGIWLIPYSRINRDRW
ncbi:MAG: hypothetical protein ANABAC_2197 [Anaerolineae bacterium]|nr:MAG: hypothetical protein ANABAC_2197 [Anaerolineae bacterium]